MTFFVSLQVHFVAKRKKMSCDCTETTNKETLPPTTITIPAATAATIVTTTTNNNTSQQEQQQQSNVVFEVSTQTPTTEMRESPLFTQRGYCLKTNGHSHTALNNIHKMKQHGHVIYF